MNWRTIKIRFESYKRFKRIAADRLKSLADLFDEMLDGISKKGE